MFETIYFLYLQGSVVVLKGSSDWTSAPEDAEKYYIADLQTYCPEQPFNFAYGLSIFFAVRYILNHNSKKQIKNNNDKRQNTIYLSGCWGFLLVLHAGRDCAGKVSF